MSFLNPYSRPCCTALSDVVYTHTLTTCLATVLDYSAGNRMFILTAVGNARQWRKHEAELRTIQKSFFVPEA
jgi:hypothetical protein